MSATLDMPLFLKYFNQTPNNYNMGYCVKPESTGTTWKRTLKYYGEESIFINNLKKALPDIY